MSEFDDGFDAGYEDGFSEKEAEIQELKSELATKELELSDAKEEAETNSAVLVEAVNGVREVLPDLLEYLEVCYDHENLTARVIRVWISRLEALTEAESLSG